MQVKFEKIFEHSNEGLLVVNAEGLIEMLNPKLLKLFGYDEKSELIGQKLERLIPMRYAKSHVGHRKKYNQTPSNRSMGVGRNLMALRKDGSEFAVEVSLSHYEEEGQTKSIAFVVDITKRLEKDRELRILNTQLEEEVIRQTKEVQDQNEMLKTIAENFPNGNIFIIDKNFVILWADGSILRSMGLTDSSLKGISFSERLGTDVKPVLKEKLPALFEGNTVKFELDFKDKYFHIYGVPLKDKNGKTDRALLVEMDVTIEKLAELNIERSLKKEKELNELKSRFVAMASHEFRTPLSTIDTSATLISKYKGEEKNEKRQVHVDRIKRMVSNLTQILNDFLSLEKLESGIVKPSLNDFVLNELINELIDEVNVIKREKQVININSTLKDNLRVNTDRNILKNCILNLLSNACKYSPEEAEILINLKEFSDEVLISVKDEGMGIPKEDQSMLFSRFYRARNAVNIEGTGLGLNIIKRYMEVLNGSIDFMSEHGKGSEFFLRFPKS